MKKLILSILIAATIALSASAASKSKTLIVYFSPANADTTDAVSSATPRAGSVSSVEAIATFIEKQTGADTAKIVPNPAYPLEYNKAADKAKGEADKNARPDFTLSVNPEDYDTIFIGYPIWWYKMPMVMYTFFDRYDLSGKTIVPFNTHMGSRDGGTYKEIAKLEPKAKVLDGLAVNGERTSGAEKSVADWLKKIGMKN